MHKTIFIAATMLFLVLAVVLSPDIALQASLSGISLWWNLVFPGLLPFLILYEFMLAFGLIHGFNALLSPFMRRVLKLPPAAGLPLLMSFSSGFPTGVEPTVKLLQNNELTTSQTQRLISYIHLPNPVFIVVILGSGVFHMPQYGYMILLSIWLAALLLMLIHASWTSRNSSLQAPSAANKTYFVEAMQLGQQLDGRSFGKVLGDSVYSSVQKLFVIGGFIIFASVIAAFIDPLLSRLLPSFPFIEQVLLEQHIGSFAIANWSTGQQSIIPSLALIAACLSFTGISGILQVSYYCTSVGISMLAFLRYRILHATASFLVLFLLWQPLNYMLGKLLGTSQATFFTPDPSSAITNPWLGLWLPSLFICLMLILLTAITHLWHKAHHRR